MTILERVSRYLRPKALKKAGKTARKKAGRSSKIRQQIRRGAHPTLGFLHIPKSGGSSVASFGKALPELGKRFPCHFDHAWTVAEILKKYPDMKLSFILRDPLERAISGFNSRLRQGRPTYNNLWRTAEAAAFAHLPSTQHYLDALLSDDEYHRSVLAYARKSIAHLRWNYSFYFGKASSVPTIQDHILEIGTMDDIEGFLERLCAASDLDPALVTQTYKKKHVAAVATRCVLETYGPEEICRMRRHFSAEYEVYDALQALRAKRQSDSRPALGTGAARP